MGILDRFRKSDSSNSPESEDPDWPTLVQRAQDRQRALAAHHDETWGLGQADWAADLTAGTITFSSQHGALTGPVQVVGTLSDGEWLWGWDHPSVPEPLRRHAQLVREYGERHDLSALTTRKIAASENDAWVFACVASDLGRAQGVYRGPTEDGVFVFMTVGELSVADGGGAEADALVES